MSVTVYLSLLMVAGFGASVPIWTRRLPPQVATWVLTIGATTGALAANGALAFLSLPLFAQIPVIARLGGWSSTVLAEDNPVRTPIALIAVGALALSLVRFCRRVVQTLRSTAELRLLAVGLPVDRELVVVADETAFAFAVPGRRHGHIVASSGLLHALAADERRALLAHESNHLRHRHHLHIAITRISAAACPLLAAAPRATRLACERWADEAAASASTRHAVANALAVAARARFTVPAHTLAIASDSVAYRVHALRLPVQRYRPWLAALPVAVLLAVLVCDANALLELHVLFERAQAIPSR